MSAADIIGCNPIYLMTVISFETGRTFSPKARNPNSSASGLIQFMSATAKRLGTTIQVVRLMSFEDQLRLTVRYFDSVLPKNRLYIGLADLYMAVLWPKAVGKPMNYRLFRSPSRSYQVNRGLDKAKKGYVTKADCMVHLKKHFKEVSTVLIDRGF